MIIYQTSDVPSRLMSYPQGTSYLKDVLDRFAGWSAPGSDPDPTFVSRQILDQVDLAAGKTYVTVPFDLAEAQDLGNLAEGRFYVETEKSRTEGQQYLSDLSLVTEVNRSVYQLVTSGHFALVFDRGEPGPNPGSDRDPSMWKALSQRVFTSKDDEAVLVGACFNSIDELRFVVRIEETLRDGAVPSFQLDLHEASPLLIICSIFDWSGYLLWFSSAYENRGW